MRKIKAFTLAEIVVTILVITVALTATLSITKSKMEKVDKYYYYMAFSIARDISQNVVAQGNFAIIEEETPTPETPEEPESETPPLSTAGDLCTDITKMYNVAESDCSIVPWAYSQARVSGDFSNVTPQIVLNNGLRLFIASDFKEIPQLASEDVNALEKDRQGFVLYVDSNGQRGGKNRLDSDVFVFYLLKSGKMLPDRGSYAVNSPTGPDSADSLSVNVLYDDFSSDKRVLKTLMRSVDYRTGACASGTVISETYCIKPNGTIIQKNALCTDVADCRIQINKPMRKLF